MAASATEPQDPNPMTGVPFSSQFSSQQTAQWIAGNWNPEDSDLVSRVATSIDGNASGKELLALSEEKLTQLLGVPPLKAPYLYKLIHGDSEQGPESVLDEKIDELSQLVGDLRDVVVDLRDNESFDAYSAASFSYDEDAIREAAALRQPDEKFCMISKQTLRDAPPTWPHHRSRPYIKMAHLYPRASVAQGYAEDTFGPKNGYARDWDLHSVRDIFILRYDLESAYDQRLFVFYPADMVGEKYKVVQITTIADEYLREKHISAIKDWDSYNLGVSQWDGEVITIPETHLRPFRRVIGYHLKKAAKRADAQGWPLCDGVDLRSLETHGDRLMGMSRVSSPRGNVLMKYEPKIGSDELLAREQNMEIEMGFDGIAVALRAPDQQADAVPAEGDAPTESDEE